MLPAGLLKKKDKENQDNNAQQNGDQNGTDTESNIEHERSPSKKEKSKVGDQFVQVSYNSYQPDAHIFLVSAQCCQVTRFEEKSPQLPFATCNLRLVIAGN